MKEERGEERREERGGEMREERREERGEGEKKGISYLKSIKGTFKSSCIVETSEGSGMDRFHPSRRGAVVAGSNLSK
jgi:hypothetical protein